jgi:FtsP/CotA-like multicopper oxidase with cupredoxin domain
MDVAPVEVDRMIIAVAETYDVIVSIPEDMSYEFKATTEDRTKSTSLWLGSGMKMSAPILPHLNYFEGMKMMNSMMKMNGTMDDMGMKMQNQIMDMNAVMYPELNPGTSTQKQPDTTTMVGMDMSSPATQKLITMNYSRLRSIVKTSLPDSPTKFLRFDLTGNMSRYVWSIDNKTVSETDKILIRKGENVRIVLYNGTMMRHPISPARSFFPGIERSGRICPFEKYTGYYADGNRYP